MAALLLLLAVNSTPAAAAEIQALHLFSEDGKQHLNIAMDEAAEYQVFNLEGPVRLVLNFSNTTVAKGVAEAKGDGIVEYVSPVQGHGGTRVEIGLGEGAQYNISEKGNDLTIIFSREASADESVAGAVLQDISVQDRGGVTELVLRGQNMDANHNTMVLNDGKTMVVDFWGGASKLAKEHYTYTAQRLHSVVVGSEAGRLRLVVSLTGAGESHQLDADANSMVIRFGQPEEKRAASGMAVEAVDFQPDGESAYLVVRTNESDPIVSLKESDSELIIDLKNATLVSSQERSQDLRAFPGPVKQVDSYGVGGDVRIVARLRQRAVITSFQSGNVLTLSLKPEEQASRSAVASGGRVYSGQKVSFNYKDIDIRNALQLIAEMSDLNIIMSDDVTGVLTMRLVDVPWDQALDLILQARGLGKEVSGNVIRIAPLTVLKADADARKEAQTSAEKVAPLETEFITLGYASVNDMKTILEGGSVKSETESTATTTTTESAAESSAGSSGSSELKLLSSRGSILLDERSNTMIVTDTRERLNNIKRLVAMIDQPTKQILIEARVVEATDSFSRDLGVKWGGQYSSTGDRFSHTIGVGTPATTGNVVDLGAAVAAGSGGAIGYTLGTVGGSLNINLELSAAEQAGDIKVVSSPRVFTSNLQEALIEQDTQIPFTTTTISSGSTTVSSEMVSAKLTLKVTPQVTADKRIIMQLEVNKDTPIASATTGGNPTIDKKQVLTKLLVKNGETVVLGGIYTQTTSDTESGVPVLMDIPVLGHLFKRKQKTDNRNELLIFITPTIVGDEVTTL